MNADAAVSLESMQTARFVFAPGDAADYSCPGRYRVSGAMIVCSCNVLSDRDVRGACQSATVPPRTPGQVYGCLGCSAQCGRCAKTIRKIMDEALGSCARSCCNACPHHAVIDDAVAAAA